MKDTHMETKEWIAKALYCSSVIEDEVADAYDTLSGKADRQIVKTLLKYISLDSRKHAAVLRGLAESLLAEPPTEGECDKYIGKAGKLVKETARKVEEVGMEDLPKLIEEMVTLENFIGEEYLIVFHLKSLKFLAEKEGVDLGDISTVLDWIIEDEKRHEILVKNIGQMVR